MSGIITANGTPGGTAYTTLENASGQYWNTNTSAFENPLQANQGHYAIALAELWGGGQSGIYTCAMPAVEDVPAQYWTASRFQAGGSPDFATDAIFANGNIQWTGESEDGVYNALPQLEAIQGADFTEDADSLYEISTAVNSVYAKLLAVNVAYVAPPAVDTSGNFTFTADYDYTTSSPISFSCPCTYDIAGATFQVWNPSCQINGLDPGSAYPGFSVSNVSLTAGTLTGDLNIDALESATYTPNNYPWELRITLASGEIPSPVLKGTFTVVF